MKIFLIVSLSAALIAGAVLTSAMSAPSGAPEDGQHWRDFRHAKMAVMARRLGLNDEQKSKLKSIRQQSAEAVKAIRDNRSLTPEQQQAQIDPVRRSARDQMRAVLTPDQQARFAQLAGHPRMWNAWAAHRMRVGAIAHRLGLTSEQMAKVRDIQNRTAAAVKPIRADATLTPEQKKAKVRDLVQAGRQEARGVLTPEQQAKLEKMRHRLLAPLGPFN